MRLTPAPEAVLFDLDGTLIDSAPDLLAALDHVLGGLGQPASDHAALREHVSRGAVGLLAAGVPDWPRFSDAERDRCRERLLDFYEGHCWNDSAPFPGIEGLLSSLSERKISLGIVTNKISRFAEPVVERAGWSDRFGCLVTGDRVRRPKPDPEAVLKACDTLGVRPERTLFLGDDRRDVQAGGAAGTGTAVAAWGYIPAGDRPEEWGSDRIVHAPEQLLELFEPEKAS